jgi:hypothetical protein
MNQGTGCTGCRQAVTMAVIILLTATAPVASQEVRVGLRAGADFSTIRFQDPNAREQMALKPGFHLGVSAAKGLTPYLEAEASLLFSQGGSGGKGGQPWDVAMDFLELPLILRARLPARISPHLTAGFSPRLKLRCKLVDVAVVGETTCDDPVVGRAWKGMELSAIGGGGASLEVGPGRLIVEGTLVWGLTDLKKDPLPPGWAKSADLRLSATYSLLWR